MVENNIDISIIIPVYNSEKYLHDCLNSILNQTIKNIEIILVDDASSDSSGAICDHYKNKFKNIIVIHNKINSGPSKSRNIGIKLARGRYLLFIDSDDIIHKDMIKIMLENSENSDVVMCSFFRCANRDDLINQSVEYNHNLGNQLYVGEDIKNIFLGAFYKNNIDGIGSLCNKIYKSSFIKSNNVLIDESIIRAEDMWFNFEIFSLAKSVKTISQPLYYYMQDNKQSIMHRILDDQYINWVNNRKKLINYAKKLDIAIDYSTFFNSFHLNVIVYIRSLIKLNKKKEATAILDDEFFKNTLQFIGRLPYHIKFILYLLKINKLLAYYAIKCWSVF